MNTIYLSETANPILVNHFKKQGYPVHILKKNHRTYEPVCSHPDIYLCSLGPGRQVFFGNPEKLGPNYPDNIIYNAACTGRFFLHNLNYTDPDLLRAACTMEPIHVPQGYTKCNTVVVNETSIITSDRGIYKACCSRLDVLLISPGHVKLSGFPYGFLGGASGRAGDEIIFNGSLNQHPDFKKIAAFIKDRDLKLTWFPQYQLEDIGSIIESVSEQPYAETAAGSAP